MDTKELKPLFDYLDEKFAENKQQIVAEIKADIKSDLNKIQTSVDGLALLVKNYQDEHLVIKRRLEVLEEWAKMVSEKIGIPLPH